mmetsp:Transcript_10539/g.16816  ORF Transcript_10539/g.16816 Transcript_10539/m.16816 type:complete len:228 (-) Transcript_10539:260-943(-)
MRLQILDARAILHDGIDWFSTGGGDQFAHCSSIGGDFLGLDGDITGLSTSLRAWLIQEDGGIGQGEAVSPFSLRQQHGGGSKGLSQGDGVDWRTDILHDICNGKGFCLETDRLAVGGSGSRGIDVHGDWIRRRFVVQIEQLGNDQFGDGGYERHANVNDAVVQKKRRKIRRWTNGSALVIFLSVGPFGSTRNHLYGRSPQQRSRGIVMIRTHGVTVAAAATTITTCF